jgi:hypothetical protein
MSSPFLPDDVAVLLDEILLPRGLQIYTATFYSNAITAALHHYTGGNVRAHVVGRYARELCVPLQKAFI